MTKKINLLLISLVITIGVFIYLSTHHYSVKTGLGGPSLCSISNKINCDAAASSSFSEIFNIPVAVLGAVFHIFLLGFVLFIKLDWVQSSAQLKTTLRAQLGLAVFVSIVMGLISAVAIKVACPFCIAGYILSFINLYLGWNIVETSTKSVLDLTSYFGVYKSHLYYLLAIPAVSWAISGMASQHYGLDQLERYVPEKIAIWQAGTEYSLSSEIGISNTPSETKYTLVEFADFKCPHCKVASNTIKLFLKSRDDVKFIFKPFPLDGQCNPAISQKGDGSRCQLAALSLCAEKTAQKGMDVTQWIFENQERFIPVSDIKTLLPEVQKNFSLDPSAIESCMDSAETYEAIQQSANEGAQAQVEGTPTIYLNGKKLPWGHVLEVLKTATTR